MRASSKASKPHSYGDSFSRSGRRGPRNRPTSISVMPIPVATIRNSRDGNIRPAQRFSLASAAAPAGAWHGGVDGNLPGALRARRTRLLTMVPKRGLEPLRPKSLPPQGSASTNSATWATITSDYLPDAPRIVTGFSVSGSLPKAFLHQKPKIPPEPAHSRPEPGRPGPHQPSERPAIRLPEPPERPPPGRTSSPDPGRPPDDCHDRHTRP